jgi:putative ABC transport system ATP-binding protein
MSLLCLDNVTRVFPAAAGHPRAAVLGGVDLTLAPGEAVALVGRSGVGKTTLLYLAAGLGRPTSGRVLFAGADLARLGERELSRLRRRRIGLVFQNNLSLSALPVWENAALPLLLEGAPSGPARRAAEALLERVGLASWAASPTAALSGGQRRRLGLVRAMIARPELILADEPTADLDEATAAEIENLLFAWLRAEGRAALIVTHSPSIERAADRTLRLEGGRLYEGA